MRRAGKINWPAAGVIAGCTLGNFVSSKSIVNATFGIFLKPVTLALGWSRAEFSVMLLIMALVGVFCYPLAGRAVDRFGFRPVALTGNVLFALAIASLSFLNGNKYTSYAIFALVGATATLSSSVLFNKPVSLWFSRNQGLLFAVTACGMNLGFVVMPIIAAAVLTSMGWRFAYLGLASLIFAIGFPALMLVKPPRVESTLPTAVDGAEAVDGGGLSLAEARRTRAFWLLLIGMGLGAGSLSATTTHIVPILTDRNLSLTLATSVFAGLVLFNATWQLVISAILDRTRAPQVAGVFLAISVGGLAILLTASSPELLVLGGVLLGIGNGTEYGLLPYAVRRYFGAKAFGEIYGSIFGVSVLAAGVAPVLMDMVFDHVGAYTPAVVAIGGAILFSAMLTLFLPSAKRLQAPRAVEPDRGPAFVEAGKGVAL